MGVIHRESTRESEAGRGKGKEKKRAPKKRVKQAEEKERKKKRAPKKRVKKREKENKWQQNKIKIKKSKWHKGFGGQIWREVDGDALRGLLVRNIWASSSYIAIPLVDYMNLVGLSIVSWPSKYS